MNLFFGYSSPSGGERCIDATTTKLKPQRGERCPCARVVRHLMQHAHTRMLPRWGSRVCWTPFSGHLPHRWCCCLHKSTPFCHKTHTKLTAMGFTVFYTTYGLFGLITQREHKASGGRSYRRNRRNRG